MRILVVFAVLAVSVAGAATLAAGKPADPDPAESGRSSDLVVLDVAAGDSLREQALPFLWRDSDFVLASWDSEEKLRATLASVPFEIVHSDAPAILDLHLFEIDLHSTPPSEWSPKLVYRNGRKWILRMSAVEAEAWSRRGFQPVRIPRTPREWSAPESVTVFDCTNDPLVSELLSQAESSRWIDWIEKLSGEQTVEIGGTEQTIQTRHSSAMFSVQDHARGFDFVLEQVGEWHYGPSNLEVHSYDGTLGETWKNLIVTLPGRTFPGEIVMMTAHLDSTSPSAESLAPGADDNGSGSATLLEAARLFRQFRFDRTIKLAWFTGEEQGLYGSEAYVEDHPTGGIVGVVNLDMMSYDGDGDRCFEIHAGTLASSIEIGQCFDASLGAYGLDLSRDFLTSGATTASDHASFWQAGVGAIEIGENFWDQAQPGGCSGADMNPDYHTVDDTVDNVTLPYAVDIAHAGLATVAAMARPIEACFDGVPQLTAVPGESRVDLGWTAVQGAVRYRVYRSTAGCAGQWQEIGQTSATNWADLGAVEARTYDYQVEAVGFNALCVSQASNCASATPVVYHASAVDTQPVDLCPGGGAGSGDGVADPGEGLLLPVDVENDGSVALSGISGELSVVTPGVTVLDSHADWPDLQIAQHALSLPNHFGLSVPTGAPCGNPIVANLALDYENGANATTVSVPVGATQVTTLLDEDFSIDIPAAWAVVDGGSGAGSWTASNPGGRSIPSPFSEPFAIVDSDAAGSGSIQDEQLIAPAFDASGCAATTLVFDSQFRWYSGSQPEKGDVDVSTDGGQSWSNVLRIEGGDDGYPAPETKIVDLTPFVTPDPASVSLRFHYDQAVYEWWWAIDNVRVECEFSVCTPCAGPIAPPGEPSSLRLGRSLGQIVFEWDAPVPGCGGGDPALYRGDLLTLRTGTDTAVPLTCTGSSPFSIDLSAVGSADYFLVVGDNGVHEGSYGRDSQGSERSASASACRAGQDMTDCWATHP